MNHWPFIIASYVLTVGGMAALLFASWAAMRKAESKAPERISNSLDTDGNRRSTSAPSVSSEVEKRGTQQALGTSGTQA